MNSTLNEHLPLHHHKHQHVNAKEINAACCEDRMEQTDTTYG